jgi:hypothetical protein
MQLSSCGRGEEVKKKNAFDKDNTFKENLFS